MHGQSEEKSQLVFFSKENFILNFNSRLPYVEATIHDVSRMVALLPNGVPRAAMEDMQIGGFFIPKVFRIYGINFHFVIFHFHQPNLRHTEIKKIAFYSNKIKENPSPFLGAF